MSLLQSNSKVTTSTGFYDYPIDQSLRFDGSSYLSRTFSAGSSNAWTLSLWVKLLSVVADYEGVILFKTYDGRENVMSVNGGVYSIYEYKSTDTPVNNYVAYVNGANVKLRDFSSWYHFVIRANITNSVINTYVNGVISLDYTINQNTTVLSQAGSVNLGSGGGRSFSGYMANIQFIDGQALDANSFGETKSGVWIPKEYTGSYGTNGFHLTFSNASDLGEDSSGNNNDWTVN